MNYLVSYDSNGNPYIVRSDGAAIPIDARNSDFRIFLAWNAQQSTPLDYTTTIAPQGLPVAQIAANAAAARLKTNFATLTANEKDIVLVLRAIIVNLN